MSRCKAEKDALGLVICRPLPRVRLTIIRCSNIADMKVSRKVYGGLDGRKYFFRHPLFGVGVYGGTVGLLGVGVFLVLSHDFRNLRYMAQLQYIFGKLEDHPHFLALLFATSEWSDTYVLDR